MGIPYGDSDFRLGALNKLEGKEAKAAADLRTSATHARWEEFNAEQVESVIKFTRRLVRGKLAGMGV